MPDAPSVLRSTLGLGLSEADAQARLKTEGYNELPRPERRTPLRIILEVFREPMLALLIGGGVIYLLLGDLKEALILLVFATMSVVITAVQETRTERVLEALRDLTSPRALVIRDGVRKRIAGREVVRGDIVVLAEGDRVPADAALIECQDLQIDESLLTGESAPVRKIPRADAPLESRRPGGDDLPYVFAGSLVVRGTGIGEVIATGAQSEIGKIGQSLSTLETEPPRLQAQTRRLVGVFALAGGAVSVSAVLLYGMLRGAWLDAVLAGIALGMSMLPEEFPVVLTVFMAMGAWRISQARVLTRRAAAIESLGSATVLCTDKTGTLTENQMSIAELRLMSGEKLRPGQISAPTPESFHKLVQIGILASAPDPFDPMEKAFHDFGRDHLPKTGALQASEWKLVRAYGLRPDLLCMSQVWQAADGRPELVVAAKGAPEAIAALCQLSESEFSAVKQSVEGMAAEGQRVLGVARASFAPKALPDSQQDFAFEFLGLVGLADPLRSGVPAAVSECRSAGIRVVMITGDYPATAMAIAREAGLNADEVVTGEAVENESQPELARRLRTASVFARIMPDQKLQIVNALKALGEIVAMTGDGVNDAPSLKAAHIGIAMGGRGTDVAREASSIVLLDDDFGSIVKAIRLGRRIYDNLRKATGFIFAVHVPIAGLALMPLLFGLPILFGPMHIAFLEMVIDPVCSLVFEAEIEEDDVMRRPPRPTEEPLFSGPVIAWGLLQGVFAFALVAMVFLIALKRDMPETEVRALTFFSLVLAIVSLIFVNRSFDASPLAALRRPNTALAWVLLAVVAMLGLTLLSPQISSLFRFGPLHLDDLAVTLGAGVILFVLLEFMKRLGRGAGSAAVARLGRIFIQAGAGSGAAWTAAAAMAISLGWLLIAYAPKLLTPPETGSARMERIEPPSTQQAAPPPSREAKSDLAEEAGPSGREQEIGARPTAGGPSKFLSRKLPSGLTLNIPSAGMEANLLAFLDREAKMEGVVWFDFDRLQFETGKAKPQALFQEQLKNIADILAAYPGVIATIGGYTDNVGARSANKRLSKARADWVMRELTRMGVDASRLTTKGYGESHPIATNDTEEGRARNRRISLGVTRK